MFPKIQCPVLVLQGDPDHGGLIKDEDIEKAKTLLLSAEFYKCKNVGHGLHLEDKEQIMNQIIPFLKRLKVGHTK